MHPLVSFLREAGVMAPDGGASELHAGSSGSSPSTGAGWSASARSPNRRSIRYERLARRFMAGRVLGRGELDVAGLTGADVSAFLLEECARVSVGSAKGRVAELRSLLRFLYLRGFTELALADSVPSVAGWRDTEIPATMRAGRCRAAAGIV